MGILNVHFFRIVLEIHLQNSKLTNDYNYLIERRGLNSCNCWLDHRFGAFQRAVEINFEPYVVLVTPWLRLLSLFIAKRASRLRLSMDCSASL